MATTEGSAFQESPVRHADGRVGLALVLDAKRYFKQRGEPLIPWAPGVHEFMLTAKPLNALAIT
jgi:hypothetical protein